MLYIWRDDDEIVIECSKCDNADFEFFRGADTTPTGWILKMITHAKTYHPEIL